MYKCSCRLNIQNLDVLQEYFGMCLMTLSLKVGQNGSLEDQQLELQ